MVVLPINRRNLLASMGALAAIPHAAHAEDYLDIEWTDLIPAGQTAIPPVFQELLQHDQALLSSSNLRPMAFAPTGTAKSSACQVSLCQSTTQEQALQPSFLCHSLALVFMCHHHLRTSLCSSRPVFLTRARVCLRP